VGAVKGDTTGWRPGQAPRPPKPGRLRRLAAERPASGWQTVTWREGTRGAMRSRFARLRVRPAHRDEQRSDPRPEEELLIEWPRGEPAPTKYWLSTLPALTPLADLVRLAKLRWRIRGMLLEQLHGDASPGHRLNSTPPFARFALAPQLADGSFQPGSCS